MEFNEQYLTYEEYRELGGTLDIMPFNLLELEARTNINRETQNRLSDNIPMEVKVCVFRLVEGMAYDGNYKDQNTLEKQEYINKIIYENLTGVIYNGVPLTYRGVI